MKRAQTLSIALAAAILSLLSGCAVSRQHGTLQTVIFTPPYGELTPDSCNVVQLDGKFQIPPRYFSQRSRLVILPQLMAGDTIADRLQPVVLDAPIYSKKKERLEKLEGYSDPYEGCIVNVKRTSRSLEYPYKTSVCIPDWASDAHITGVVTSDGCGKCSSIDTISIASINDPITLIDVKKSLDITWMEPEFVIRPKYMDGKGVANLQFIINKSDINLELGNNRREMEDMVKTLSPILEDTLATLVSIDINGMASADGPLSINIPLSRNRAEAAKKWLVNRMDIAPEIQDMIIVGSRPEGWQPVLEAMNADGHPCAAAVGIILEEYADSNDDVQEQHIRSLPCWKDIRNRYLSKDRKVEYAYSYTIKSFTSDDELIYMYGKRPDAFNEEELLRVAALAGTDEEMESVYNTIIEYFPQSQIAANNLAVLYIRKGDEEQARYILSCLTSHSDETLNTLAASYVYSNDYERAVELLQEIDMPTARYNLGLMKARLRKLDEAYMLLRQFGDVNSAISALSVNRNKEAEQILEALEDDSPVAEYARALAAARLNKITDFHKHIVAACADAALRSRAAVEPDFQKYHYEEAFQALINDIKENSL